MCIFITTHNTSTLMWQKISITIFLQIRFCCSVFSWIQMNRSSSIIQLLLRVTIVVSSVDLFDSSWFESYLYLSSTLWMGVIPVMNQVVNVRVEFIWPVVFVALISTPIFITGRSVVILGVDADEIMILLLLLYHFSH